MKKLMIALWVGVLAASAQAGGLGFFGSYWDPKDGALGYGAGARLQMNLNSVLALDARGGYYADLTEDRSGPDGNVPYDLRVIPVELGLIFEVPVADAVLQPYIGGGAGYYLMEAETANEDGRSIVEDVSDELGWYAVVGLKVALAKNLALVVEGQYRKIEFTTKDDNTDILFTDVAIDLEGMGMNAGLMIRW